MGRSHRSSGRFLCFGSEHVTEFIVEITPWISLKHANVLTLLAMCPEPANLCIVTDLIPRGSLWDVLHKERIALDNGVALRMMRDLAAGVDYLHSEKVLHRDIKTANLLVGERMTLKLTDFGFAKLKANWSDRETAAVGTTNYMAPEVIAQVAYSWPADVYSSAMVFYEILYRLLPFAGMPEAEIRSKVVREGFRPPVYQPTFAVPPTLIPWIQRSWAQNPADRPCMRDILRYLESIAGT